MLDFGMPGNDQEHLVFDVNEGTPYVLASECPIMKFSGENWIKLNSNQVYYEPTGLHVDNEKLYIAQALL